ncbi:MAG: hypothetical protein JJ863_05110 [Deltaproteobacteria bacterium]|nr:hypothetical protein [Deltaproteobacteria bacterium]
MRFDVTLVFRAGDQSFVHEPWAVETADRAEALSRSKREGIERRFGREFLGYSRFELFTAGSVDIDDLPAVETRRSAELIPVEDVPASDEPGRKLRLEGLEEVRWWEIEGAFGPASELGAALRRCASEDEALAKDSAELVGEWIAHQTTLYPATSVALPFVLRLLCEPELACHSVLEPWFAVAVDAALHEPTEAERAAVRAEVEAMTPAVRALLFPDGFEARDALGEARAADVRDVLRRERASLVDLAACGNETAKRALAQLGIP